MVWIAQAKYKSNELAMREAQDLIEAQPELQGYVYVNDDTLLIRNSTKEKAQEAREWIKEHTAGYKNVKIGKPEPEVKEVGLRDKIRQKAQKFQQYASEGGNILGNVTGQPSGQGNQGGRGFGIADSMEKTGGMFGQPQQGSQGQQDVWVAEASFATTEQAQKAINKINNSNAIPSLKGYANARGSALLVNNSTKPKAKEAMKLLSDLEEPAPEYVRVVDPAGKTVDSKTI